MLNPLDDNSPPRTLRSLVPLLAIGALLSSALLLATVVNVALPAGSGCAGGVLCLELGGARLGIMDWIQQLLAAATWPVIALTTFFVWWRYRHISWISRPLAFTLPLLVGRLGLALYPDLPLNLAPEAAQIGLVLALQGLVATSAAAAFRQVESARQSDLRIVDARFARLALTAVAAVFGALVSGSAVQLSVPAGVCPSWPLCGVSMNMLQPGAWLHLAHRGLVAVAGLLLIALAWIAWRRYRAQTAILVPATIAVTLLAAQSSVGAYQQLAEAAPWLGTLHSATSAAVWVALISLLANLGPGATTAQGSEWTEQVGLPARRQIRDYVQLTKPIILLLLLFTTLSGMVVAAGGLPPLGMVLWTMLGGGLAAAGSSAINQYIDRRRDRLMVRTAGRPIAARRIAPAEGLAFGLALCITSFYLLAVLVNPAAAVLAVLGILYYVVLYSLLLKHATVQNIVIGGGAGAIPPLVGWAAVTGGLTWPSLLLFAIIFFWTPPHFWALALVRRKDYQRAGVPMLPVVRGELETRRQIFVYTVGLVVLTLALPFAGLGGWIYAISAVGLGLWLIRWAWKVWRSAGNKIAWKMYRYSSMYLAFLFLALMLDAVL